ncbi:MAG: hypothetical protein OHK0037_03770 [Elainellaceae cyanobacterium]
MGKYALLIGVSNYQDQDAVRPSPSARNDVNALRNVLLHPEIGGFDEAMSVFDPDRMELEERIEEFFRKCSANDLAVMYFSGRGLRDDLGRAYFATCSTRRNLDGQLVKATALPVGSVRDLSGSSRSRQQVMILDCGFDAQIDPAVAARANGSFSIGHQLGAQGRAILLAADDAPVVLVDCDPDLSLYTHHLVEGISTGAADQDHDGEVSVKELHAYTSDRVRLVLPTMQPELIALRAEDGAIALTRVFRQDPRQRYREEVQRLLGSDGRLAPASVSILKRQRSKFGLSDADALSVEAELMQPFREHAERLQDYRQTLSAELTQAYPLSPVQLERLKELQQVLELADDEVEPIHEALMQPYAEREAAYRTHLIQYEQALTRALLQADPLSDAVRDRLTQQQTVWGLAAADVTAIERRVHQQIQERRDRDRHNLLRYEQEYEAALRASGTLGPADRLKLDKLQYSLDLRQVQIDQVEQRVQSRLQKEQEERAALQQQYRQAFLQAIAQEPTLRKSERDRLQALQMRLQLGDAEVESIEQAALHHRRQQHHQHNLARYEQAVSEHLRLACPLNESSLSALKLIQESLMLTDEEIAAIQRKLTALAEAQRRAQLEEQSKLTSASPPSPPAVGNSASPQPAAPSVPPEAIASESVANVPSLPLPPPTGQPAPPQSFVPQPGSTSLGAPGSGANLGAAPGVNLGAAPGANLAGENLGAIAPLPPPTPEASGIPPARPLAKPAAAPSPLLPDPWETSSGDSLADASPETLPENGMASTAPPAASPAAPPVPAEFTETTASDPPPPPAATATEPPLAATIGANGNVPPPPPEPEASSPDLPEPQPNVEAFVVEGLGQMPPPPPEAPPPPTEAVPQGANPAATDSTATGDWLQEINSTPPPPPDLVSSIDGSVDTPAPPADYGEEASADLGELPPPEGWSAGMPPGLSPPGEYVNGDRPLPDGPIPDSPISNNPSGAMPPAGIPVWGNGVANPVPPGQGITALDPPPGIVAGGGMAPAPQPVQAPADLLPSESGVDYTGLQGLLQERLWAEADNLTCHLMLLAAGRQKHGWLSPESLARFPCVDLNTINGLWEKYSSGHFGFTTQERIYQSLAAGLPHSRRALDFAVQVDWAWKGAGGSYAMFKPYGQLTFGLHAPPGHLPALWYWKLGLWSGIRSGSLGKRRDYGGEDEIQMLAALLGRLSDCGIR